ncbi:3-dehydroquinate synthase [subsurface metagenome]
MKRVKVRVGRDGYEVWVGSGLLQQVGQQLKEIGLGGKAVIITDRTVGNLYSGTLKQSLAGEGFEVAVLQVPAGEEQKSLETAGRLYDELSSFYAERTTPILALGGGVIGDLAGFVAATYMRGVPLIQMPTTLLAQGDSSIGGKKIAELGNIFVIFSLEGFVEKTDDRRGKGVYQKVMQGMDNLREVGVPFGFSVMVTRQNTDTLVSDKFSDMMVDKGCLIGWYFLYIPVGLNPDTSLMPTAEQRELLRVQGPQRIRNEKPILVIDFWNDAPHMGGCIAGGRHFFHINSHGDAEPCIFIHMATDNIHDKSLREIIASPYFKAFRTRQPYGENLLRPCTMIDHPEVLREICAECHPYSTDGLMCGLITSPINDALDKYSQEVAKIMDPVWEREFASFNFTPDKFAQWKVDGKKQ